MPLTEHKLFFPVVQLATNGSAALMTIHQNYGDVVPVRFFNKKFLFIAKPEYIEQVFSQEAKGNINRDSLHEAKKAMVGNGLASSRGETWVQQRRIMQPFFSKDAVTVWHGLMLEETEGLVAQLKADKVVEINLSKAMKVLVQGIIARILFGQAVAEVDKQALTANVDAIIKGAVPQLMSELLGKGWIKHLFVHQNKQFKRAVSQFGDFVTRAMPAEQNATDHSLIAQLSQAKDKHSGYTIPEDLLKDEAITLFLAGQDTTINTLIWFFYLIGQRQNLLSQDRIWEEIAAFRHEPLTTETLAKHSYTKAALQETLRHYPAGIGVSRDLLVDGFTLAGYPVPQDTTLFVSIYAVHHDPTLWEQADKFYPEHFADADLAGKRHRFAYLPFGGGIHNCIGRHLAELEMMLVIISLLREFRFSTGMTVKKAVSITMKPDRDVRVKVTPNR